jgi:sulfide dehydrogenase [flavocytochrome c] flavoprotein subunit
MSQITRRDLVKASLSLAALGGLGFPGLIQAGGPKGRVVVVGGGYGGAIAAKYVHKAMPDVRVTLVEQNPVFVSCPLSNEVLGGERELDSLTFSYRGLARRGIAVVQDQAVEVDAVNQYVRGKGGSRYNYDRLVLSPGIQFRWDKIQGMSPEHTEDIPHAWQAGLRR